MRVCVSINSASNPAAVHALIMLPTHLEDECDKENTPMGSVSLMILGIRKIFSQQLF